MAGFADWESTEVHVLNCGVVKGRLNDRWMSYPFAVIGEARGGDPWIHVQGQAPRSMRNRGYVLPPDRELRAWNEGKKETIYRWAHVRVSLGGWANLFQLMEIPFLLPGKVGAVIGAINEEQTKLRSAAPSLLATVRRQELGFKLLGLLLPHARMREDAALLLAGRSRIEPALKFLEANIAGEVTRADLARCVHLSESRFHDVFKKAAGMAPLEYVQKLRIQRAQELLFRSELSIAEVARQSGFADPFHFSRLFKCRCGQSPREYRTAAQRSLRLRGIL